SAYRNITFRFEGTYWKAARALLLAGVTVVLTLGLGYPWARRHVQRFLVTETTYGSVIGRFDADGLEFFKPYVAAVGVMLFAIALVFIVFPLAGINPMAGSSSDVAISTATGYFGLAMYTAYLQARIFNVVWRNTRIGPIRFEASMRAS